MSFEQQYTFTHNGRAFTIEADGWPDEASAATAIVDLEIWTMQWDEQTTARMHAALEQEREALVHDTPAPRESLPLDRVRKAQRNAVKTGLQGRNPGKLQPTVSLEAYQRSEG